jgi:hypothetical protein
MKLVIHWTHGDGCTYSCEETVPVEYESEEAFLVDFEDACAKVRSSKQWDFTFAGHCWSVDHFYENGRYYAPTIGTLEQWFEDNKTTI